MSKSNPPEPLHDFQKLGHNTWLFTPTSTSATGPLILLLTWMDAAPKHNAKYAAAYQRLFPQSRILLVSNNLPDFFRSKAAYRGNLAPAISVLQEQTSKDGKILVHSFSNGGANQLIQIASLFKEQANRPLPYQLQVLDSSPSMGKYRRSHAAMLLSLPRTLFYRLFGSLLIHIFLILWGAYYKITQKEPEIHKLRRQLNDSELFQKEAPKVYLYSKADQMVGWEEVESHADDAEAKGWVVTRVKFESSPHAGHVLEDADKYWGAVTEAWNRVSKS